jgi:4'-phosphopantetheinyl transferase
MSPEKYLNSMIGYHAIFENSICAMAMTQGSQRKVINIGIGVKQSQVEPPGVSAATYAQSFAHKVSAVVLPDGITAVNATHRHPLHMWLQLTPLEMSFISGDLDPEVITRRLCIMLAIKAAYIKAIGQPAGFDWSRLEFNLPEKKAFADNHPLQGWEFRIFKAHLGVARRDQIVEEQYQCVVAFFRGSAESEFIWYENKKDLESWVQFIFIDQMVRVAPKLSA